MRYSLRGSVPGLLGRGSAAASLALSAGGLRSDWALEGSLASSSLPLVLGFFRLNTFCDG